MKKNKFKESLRPLLLWNRYYNYAEYRIKLFIRRLSQRTQAGKSMIDVGAGESQYKKYFNHLQYTAQDLGIGDKDWDFSKLDIVSEIYQIPVEDSSFDYILCTQVLEHLKYPHKAFAEFSRILKPGGELYVTCPLAWVEHQVPYDYFRYTQYALRFLGEENGFEIIEINKVGGKFSTVTRLFIDINLTQGIKNKLLNYAVLAVLYIPKFIIGFIAHYLDKFDKHKRLTMQYEVIYKKL